MSSHTGERTAGMRQQRPSSASSTEEDLKAASQAVEQEINVVRALKRLSIGNSLNFDPDLPFNETEYGEAQFMQQDEEADDLDPYEYDPESMMSASNKLMWVPANAHPNLAPENFRKHVQSTVNEITEQLQKSPELSRSGSLRRSSSRSSRVSKRPSIKQLTEELENLSRMAGLDSTDAITLARTLSSSTLGVTSEEKSAYSHDAATTSMQSNDSDETIDVPFYQNGEDNQLKRSRWTTYRRGGSGRYSQRPHAEEPLRSRSHTPLRSEETLETTPGLKFEPRKPDPRSEPRTAPPQQMPPPKPQLRRTTPSENLQDKPLPPPPGESMPQKLKKKKTYGILSSGTTTGEQQRKKSSWGWLRDRTSSQSSTESASSEKADAELPPTPDDIALSVTPSPEIDSQVKPTGHSRNRHQALGLQNGQQHRTSSAELKDKEKAKEKETVREATKKSFSKLFRRKASSESKENIRPERGVSDLEPTSISDTGREVTPKSSDQSLRGMYNDLSSFDTVSTMDSQQQQTFKQSPQQQFTLDPRGQREPSPEQPESVHPVYDEKEMLKQSLKIEDRSHKKPNSPLEYTDSAFGFPLPPASHSTVVMLDYRFPIHVERAIYRLSHVKLADARRPLRQQVLLSNFMYAYLNLVNHTLYLQQVPEQTHEPGIEEKMLMGQNGYAEGEGSNIYDDEEIFYGE